MYEIYNNLEKYKKIAEDNKKDGYALIEMDGSMLWIRGEKPETRVWKEAKLGC